MKLTIGIFLSPTLVMLPAALSVLFGPPMEHGAAPVFLLATYGLALVGVLLFAVPFSFIAKRMNWSSGWHYALAGLVVGMALPGIFRLLVGRPQFVGAGGYLGATVLLAPLATVVALGFWLLAVKRRPADMPVSGDAKRN